MNSAETSRREVDDCRSRFLRFAEESAVQGLSYRIAAPDRRGISADLRTSDRGWPEAPSLQLSLGGRFRNSADSALRRSL